MDPEEIDPHLFDFPYHKVSTEYPESGTRVQLNGNYVFTAPPSGPDLRKFTLKFPTMVYYAKVLEEGEELEPGENPMDIEKNRQYNMATLEDFYNRHKMYKSFKYPHPIYGELEVKFFSPLRVPQGMTNGGGAVEEFQVELLEIQN